MRVNNFGARNWNRNEQAGDDASASASSSSSSTSTSSSPRIASTQKYLTNCKSLYRCIYCRTHLADHDELISRSFQGNYGRAYLFNSVINVRCGQAEQRELNTGSHAVADIFCSNCDNVLGWKYERAYVETQKYKEGKYIIELAHVIRENRHLEIDRTRNLSHDMETMRLSGQNRHEDNQQSSQSPSPSTSSSSGCVMDDDDELMFPFYDDLNCNSSRLSHSLGCSTNSSSNKHIRRSMLSTSQPYDWKYIAKMPPEHEALECEHMSGAELSGLASSLKSTSQSAVSSSFSSAASPSSHSLESQYFETLDEQADCDQTFQQITVADVEAQPVVADAL